MKHFIHRLVPLIFLIMFLGSSCTEQKVNTEEKTEITTMDSTAQKVKATTEELENQTKRVEESLEKLDKEFENKN